MYKTKKVNMKKILLALVIACSFVACDDSKTTSTTENKKDSVENKIDSTADAKKDKIDSTADAKKDKVDSTAKMAKDSLNHKK